MTDRLRKRRAGAGSGSGALLRYATGWILVAVITALALGAVIRGVGSDEEVPLPPVRATELDDAAMQAGCELRRARARDRLNPPVDGPPTRARIRPGVYERPLPPATLAAAVRQGIVVIHYRPDLDEGIVEQLGELQKAVPEGTIVAANGTRMAYEVAVTAYRRLLGCRTYSSRAVDAVRLFRGRYIGRGPDR